MPDTTVSLLNLKLNADEREQVADIAGDLIAVHVYRELQRTNEAAARVASSGCNIIGNCSSSSKSALLGRTRT